MNQFVFVKYNAYYMFLFQINSFQFRCIRTCPCNVCIIQIGMNIREIYNFKRIFIEKSKSECIQQFKTVVQNKNKKQRYATISTPSYRIFLTFILITQINNFYQVSGRLIKNIPTSFCLRFLKMPDIAQKSRYC